MSATDRENRLLVAENWTKIYQSFRNADFQSYDFENLRRTMVNYLRQNYPEDFNDYIESSEYLALIDLIAFLGQNIAFRVDLNARENFLELAERRDSILRLARVISYNAKRNIAASGLLKFTSVQTTESVIDSNGRNLANQVITWNDVSNQNWYDQFIRIVNAAMPATQQFGNPSDSATIYGIPTSQYRLQAANTDVPVYSFNKVVSGASMNFEITSTTFSGESFIYEEPPRVGNSVACIYRDDGQGAGSLNTGFFFNFTQGSLNTGTFTITQPSSNESIDINTPNINNSDVWLYQLDMSGIESTLWSKVPSLTGNNIIYNSINNNVKSIYGVTTKASDEVSLVFGDGTFGNLPQGSFRVYYRISNGLSYVINTQDIRNVTVDIPYISSLGQLQTLTVSLALTASVSNSSPSESNTSIKTNAPQVYYTQNRMITGEDYNISPLSTNQQVLKVLSVNRTSSGISRYFDLVDPTSKYSSTNLFADDGVIYTENYTPTVNFSYVTKDDITRTIYNTIFNILKHIDLRNFYYSKFIKDAASDGFDASWQQTSYDVTTSTGTIEVSSLSSPNLQYITIGSLIKFSAPVGYYFDTTAQNNKLVKGNATITGSSLYIWAEVVSINNGSYTLNKIIPSSFVTTETVNNVITDITHKVLISKLIPKFVNTIVNTSTISTMIGLIYANESFGLTYNITTSSWQIIKHSNLNTIDAFSLAYQADTSNRNIDSSWLLLFTPSNGSYIVTSRETRYIFESDKQLRFYFDGTSKIYDTQSNSIVNDLIKVLSINSNPSVITTLASGLAGDTKITVSSGIGIIAGMKIEGYGISENTIVVDVTTADTVKLTLSNPILYTVTSEIVSLKIASISTFTNDIVWQISSEYIGTDGYIDTKKVVISFLDTDNNGIVDDPDLFETLIAPNISPLTKYIIEQKYSISTGQEDYRYVDNISNTVIILSSESQVGSTLQYKVGQYFYFYDAGVVKQLNATGGLIVTLDYKVYIGRDKLKFQYTHSADYDSRIDPGTSNIIDVYVLMNEYDITFRQWLNGSISTKPLPPSSNELYNTLSPNLNLIKSISDEIVYHPVSYTVLFGSTAIPELQATFKVIKNPEQVVSDNDIKSRVITAINQFFAIDNWNFGDYFYFTELSTYVINSLAPDIVSFVIVPTQTGLNFGSLFEITANSDQLFISGATVNDIEIISGITTTNIKSVSGTSTPSTTSNQSITSSPYGSL